LYFLLIYPNIAASEEVMGKYKSGWLSKALLWSTFIAMGAAAVAMFFYF